MSPNENEIQPVQTGLPEDADVIDVTSPDGSVSAPDLASPSTTADVEPAVEATTESIADDSAPASEESAESEERPRFQRTLNPNEHAELQFSPRAPLKNRHLLSDDDFLSLMQVDIDELNAYADNYPNLSVLDTEAGLAWMQRTQEAQQYLMRGNALLGSLIRDTALWRQTVTSGAEQLRAGRPKFGEAGEGNKLVGEAALMKIQALTGLGAVIRVPLWHTGIWVCLKAPTEAALLELDRRIGAEKILLGRQSNGMLFAGTSVYFTSYLVNFALAHMYDATVKYVKPEDLKSIIKVTDIPSLLWGLLCTIYPNGYPFRQPCVVDPTVCTHTVEELLDVGKLSWTDERALSEWQRRQMVRKLSKFPPEELKRYEEEHSFNKHATVELHPGLSMELKVPTIAEYEEAGYAWVDSIVQQVDQAFGGTLKGEERNDFIMERGQMTALRQYAHWIQRLVLNGTEIVDDPTTIGEVISSLTSDQTIFANFFNGVGNFINNSTISLIAIPKYDCPACGKPQPEEVVKHPHLIALDVAQVFFTLLDRRVRKVLERVRL